MVLKQMGRMGPPAASLREGGQGGLKHSKRLILPHDRASTGESELLREELR